MAIEIAKILPIKNLGDYKLHLACWNKHDQPLDVFVESRDDWIGWNRYRGGRNDFNRPFILSLIDFYHESDIWLFGGVFRVQSRRAKRYEIELVHDSAELVGRLKVRLARPGRSRAFYLENYYSDIEIFEILRECYTGEEFCGYENINHGFRQLELIWKNERQDWKAALQNVKGVYLITDEKNGKRYVGSAYGDFGIWSRWACYIGTGHGWNDVLTRLIKKEGLEYARENFRFCLLEYRSMRIDDRIIIERETYWKEALLSRGRFGYNKN